MRIDSERLTILALEPNELAMYADQMIELGNRLGFHADGNPEEWFANIVRKQALLAQNDPLNVLWHTFWLIIRKTDARFVGSIDFKHVPFADGTVEIGYGMEKAFEGMGYMTETVRAFSEHAIRHLGIKHVIAETEKENIASMRVLEKSGFVRTKETDSAYWWEYRPYNET